MSEYMEKYAVSRMIGSPPGYVGYEEAGQLTEKVRRRPYSVVLFDEIEKAHPDVMNILLQILDEGKINDAQGRTVDFSNTVICMTSNAGSSDQSTSSLGFNKSEEQRSAEKTRKALAQFLRPEFLGRVDEVITFKPLSEETLQGIAARMLDEYKPGMDAKGIAYRYTPAALKALVKKSEGGKFGARDLRRVIRKAEERLKYMTFYSTTPKCLRGFLLEYFGEAAPKKCGNCSCCLAAEQEAQLQLETSRRRAADNAHRLEKPRRTKSTAGAAPLSEADEKLLNALYARRKWLAGKQNVPAFRVFSDATLREMVEKKPLSLDELLNISGVGEKKAARYGTTFLRIIEDAVENRE